jgi:hypothetical protein
MYTAPESEHDFKKYAQNRLASGSHEDDSRRIRTVVSAAAVAKLGGSANEEVASQ